MPRSRAQKPRGGVVTLTTSMTDTLERQTILGLEARRIKAVMVKQTVSEALTNGAKAAMEQLTRRK